MKSWSEVRIRRWRRRVLAAVPSSCLARASVTHAVDGARKRSVQLPEPTRLFLRGCGSAAFTKLNPSWLASLGVRSRRLLGLTIFTFTRSRNELDSLHLP